MHFSDSSSQSTLAFLVFQISGGPRRYPNRISLHFHYHCELRIITEPSLIGGNSPGELSRNTEAVRDLSILVNREDQFDF